MEKKIKQEDDVFLHLDQEIDIIIKEWASRNLTPLYVKEKIERIIDKKQEDTILSYIGLEKDYNGYRISRCNGRSSSIDQILRDILKKDQELVNFLQDIASQVSVDVLKNKKEDLLKEYEDIFIRELKKLLRETAIKKAQEMVEELAEKYFQEKMEDLNKKYTLRHLYDKKET